MGYSIVKLGTSKAQKFGKHEVARESLSKWNGSVVRVLALPSGGTGLSPSHDNLRKPLGE